jgi:3-phenylpropionate/trans-cinnamate dioxygenase ferredoxin subunit
MPAKIKWYKVGEVGELKEQCISLAELPDRKILVSLVQGTYYAYAHKCPHASGHFANGYITANTEVVCPLHKYKFDLKTGRCNSSDGYFLKTFPTRVSDQGIFVGIEQKLFGIF